MTEDRIEGLLEKPYWLIDIVSKRIPAEKSDEYSLLQEYCEKHEEDIRERFVFFLLKLNCCHDLQISRDYGETFSPLDCTPVKTVPSEIYLSVDDKSLLTYDTEDTCMTLYDPSDELLKDVRELAGSVGLFVWKG